MNAQPAKSPPVDHEVPLNNFSHCHAVFLAQLNAMAELPELVAAAAKAREVARSTLEMFQGSVREHHADEENELFPAVLRSAHPGAESERVAALVRRLTGEHRALEALWKRLEHAVSANAGGKPVDIDAAVVSEFVTAFSLHARFEEVEFLPLADTILGRNGNHMAALGLSIHMRHAANPIGHI